MNATRRKAPTMLGWFHKRGGADATPTGAPAPAPTEGGQLLPVGDNCRELGGYPLPASPGRTSSASTLRRRFLRSGSTSTLSRKELHYLREYGVTRVIDLRSVPECTSSPDVFASRPGITYVNVPLFGINMHDPRLRLPGDTRDYLATGYLRMLDNHDAVRQVFSAFAEATPKECVLFHCAAGMDRTGITSMLLLGLCGVDRTSIVADYTYSFASREEVDAYIYQGVSPSFTTVDVLAKLMGRVFDGLIESYGSAEAYLLACGVSQAQLTCVRKHLVG